MFKLWCERGISYVCLTQHIYAHSRPQSLRSFWPAAGIESSGSNHFVITKEITEFCPSGFTQSAPMARMPEMVAPRARIPAAG